MATITIRALALLALTLSLTAASVFAQAAASRGTQTQAASAEAEYSCPMHPDVKSKKHGRCPKCGMNLVARAAAKGGNSVPSAPSAPAAGDAQGQPPAIPDTVVYDQNGRKLRFYTDLVRGKTVAINFIFTTCTTVCPPMSATFRRVQQELGERVGREVEMISVSVDPTTDTPERLKGFAEKFKAGPGWTFVTGSKPEIDQLLKALGASVADKNDHTPLVLVGNDAAREWTRVYGLAPVATIAKAITDAAAKGDAVKTSGAEATKSNAPAGSVAGYFPNLALLTQDGKPVRFYDDLLKGKVVMINFMFTTCNGVCSPMTANLAKVQRYLGERVGRDVVMISITVDPAADTPQVLKKYATSFHTQPGWYFLTGKKENVDWVLYKLGGYVEDKSQHSAVVIIGNEATGEWVKMHAMSRPDEIAEAVTKLMAKSGAGGGGKDAAR